MREDTIAAIATPIGQAGIGVIRISGAAALEIADRMFASDSGRLPSQFDSHTVHLGAVVDPRTREHIDQALLTIFCAPRSYTGENIIELSCHGGPAVTRRVLDATLEAGARHADPGEFTKRAFLNGKLDLAQAEAVNDIIRSQTDDAQRVALRQLEGMLSKKVRAVSQSLTAVLAGIEASIDFPDDVDEPDYDQLQDTISDLSQRLSDMLATADRGRIYRDGITVAIAGRPNVGKSSLLNALLRQSRAIVTPIPGTTRDTVEEPVNIAGIPVVAIDTAGLRESADEVERIGVQRAEDSIERAQIVLLVVDAVEGLTEEDFSVYRRLSTKPMVVVINKSDLIAPEMMRQITERVRLRIGDTTASLVSALTGNGIEALENKMAEIALGGRAGSADSVMVSNLRHRRAIAAALESIMNALETVRERQPIDLLSVDLTAARNLLGEITGETATEDLIDQIFSDFCIGK